MVMVMVMVLVLLLVAVCSFIFFLVILPDRKKNEKFNLPPGPKGLPLIGNLHQFDASAPHLYFSKLAKSYGPILSLRFGCRSAVVIQSAALAKEVLKTQDHNFCTRPTLVGQQRLSYNGSDIVFAPYNECYRDMRKLCVVHLFSSKKVQSSAPIRQEEVSRMIQKIASLSSASKVINLSDLLMDLTSSIICRLAFGKRYEDEGVERSRFHEHLHEVQAMVAAPFFTDYFPFIGRWLDKLTGQSSRLEKLFKDMDEFYEEIINNHLDPSRPKDDNHEDIIDVLLQLRKERRFSCELTLDHIKAVLMNIIVAGTDTSAAVVVWTTTELMKNPSMMRKVQEELRTSIQDKTFIDESDLPKLTYLKAIVKETFRLHNAGPLLVVREAIQKCSIQGYDILPKSLVFVSIWEIGRDPDIWNDPEIFMPERFIGSSIDFRGQDFELIPFGAGRRICPGMLLGVATVELTLANLLYTFDWKLPVGMTEEDIDFDVLPGITMHKKNPLCLVAEKYSHVD